jgi:glycosyltransferase involved in cell wall biosynthesis
VSIPPRAGGEIRALQFIRMLADIGRVDIVFTSPTPAEVVARLEAQYEGARVLAPIERELPAWRGHSKWILSRTLPSRLGFTDRRSLRRAFSQWRRPSYDVAFFVRMEGWYAFHDVVDAAEVVDFDDLMDVLTARTLEIRQGNATQVGASRAQRLSAAARDWRIRSDIDKWSAYQDQVARSVDAVLVCSDLDARKSGYANALVAPNGYELDATPVGRLEVGTPPTLTFPGYMRWEPNSDGAKYFVHEVFPLVRKRVPECRLVIAGDAPPGVIDLARAQGVVVTGRVDRMEDVLATADAVIVPIRMGGGTRIKIIEAWAQRIPVVSTTVGAEGLHTESGRELLLADSPEAFASACEAVLSDVALRRRLVDAGSQRAELLTWGAVRAHLAETLVGFVDRRSRSTAIPGSAA